MSIPICHFQMLDYARSEFDILVADRKLSYIKLFAWKTGTNAA